MSLQSVQKVSRSGNALIVNIPQKIVEIMNIELGDYLTIDWGEIIKKDKSLKKTKVSKTPKSSKIQGKIIKEDKEEVEEDELPQF